MNPIRTVLVIVAPTAQQHPAVAKAGLLAERFAASVELFVCDTKASKNGNEAHATSTDWLSSRRPRERSLGRPRGYFPEIIGKQA